MTRRDPNTCRDVCFRNLYALQILSLEDNSLFDCEVRAHFDQRKFFEILHFNGNVFVLPHTTHTKYVLFCEHDFVLVGREAQAATGQRSHRCGSEREPPARETPVRFPELLCCSHPGEEKELPTSTSTLSLPSSKSTFSQPFKEKRISEVVRIGRIITVHLSELAVPILVLLVFSSQNFVRAISSPETTAYARHVTRDALKTQVGGNQDLGCANCDAINAGRFEIFGEIGGNQLHLPSGDEV